MLSNRQKTAQTILTTCANCKKDENILFIVDETTFDVAKILWDEAKDYPNKTWVMMEDRSMHGVEPPALVAAAMLKADVMIACTKYSLTHSSAKKKAVANGTRWCNLADFDVRMMEHGGMFCDFKETAAKAWEVTQRIDGGKFCEITSESGTHITCSIEGRGVVYTSGVSNAPGVACSPPCIGCSTCAVEGTANGVIYIDGSIAHPSLRLINPPIKLTIKDGLITEISGGKQADTLRELLKSFNHPNVYNLGEIGLGLNYSGEIRGRLLEDEGCGGTIHFGFGDNRGFGGIVECPIHMDMILRNPTMKLDGKVIMGKGQIPE